MARMQLLTAAAAVLLMLTAARSASACTTTASPFFGSDWQPAFALFSTENAWKKHGAISKIDLFYNKASGCLSGLRVTYANKGETARLLGVDRVGKATASLKLGEKESIIKADVTYSSCITYFSLLTNKQQEMSVGDGSRAGTYQTSPPDTAGGSLAYVKAFTDEAAYGNLKRLQLFWTTSDCADQAPATTATPSELLKAEHGSLSFDGKQSALETSTPAAAAVLPALATASPAACRPAGPCKDGVCPTSSCALSGMGKDVSAMACFGTNVLPNPLLSLAGGNPCQHLACKLDKANCTSISLLGVGGFCTGTVVATASDAKLHATGKAFLGYPCIEHQPPLVSLLPFADYTARGTYMAKAWKVCDCSSRLAPESDSTTLQLQAPDHATGKTLEQDSLSITPPRFPTLRQFPFSKKALVDMTLPDVVSQWLGANAAAAEVPTADLTKDQISQIKQLVPNFTLPAIVVPRISAPLLRLPDRLNLPVFQIPLGNKTMHRFAAAVPNITSLPTLLLPKRTQRAAEPVISLTVPEITIPNLRQLASSFGVPAMPKLSPVFNMSVQDIIAQWAAARQTAMPLPQVHLQDQAVQALKKVVKGFRVPCLLTTNISLPLFRLPAPFPMPIVVLDGSNPATTAQVQSIIPKLSAIPTFVLPAKTSVSVRMPRLPHLTVPNITVPHFDDVIAGLKTAIESKPRLPSVNWPNLPNKNFSLPQLEVTVPKLNITLPGVAGIKLPELDFMSPEQQQDGTQLNLTGLAEMLKAIKTLTDALATSEPLTSHVSDAANQATVPAATLPHQVASATEGTAATITDGGATDDSASLSDQVATTIATVIAPTGSDASTAPADPVPAAAAAADSAADKTEPSASAAAAGEQIAAAAITPVEVESSPPESTDEETSASDAAAKGEQNIISAASASQNATAAATAVPGVMEVVGTTEASRMRLAAEPGMTGTTSNTASNTAADAEADAADAEADAEADAADAAEPPSTWQSVSSMNIAPVTDPTDSEAAVVLTAAPDAAGPGSTWQGVDSDNVAATAATLGADNAADVSRMRLGAQQETEGNPTAAAAAALKTAAEAEPESQNAGSKDPAAEGAAVEMRTDGATPYAATAAAEAESSTSDRDTGAAGADNAATVEPAADEAAEAPNAPAGAPESPDMDDTAAAVEAAAADGTVIVEPTEDQAGVVPDAAADAARAQSTWQSIHTQDAAATAAAAAVGSNGAHVTERTDNQDDVASTATAADSAEPHSTWQPIGGVEAAAAATSATTAVDADGAAVDEPSSVPVGIGSAAANHDESQGIPQSSTSAGVGGVGAAAEAQDAPAAAAAAAADLLSLELIEHQKDNADSATAAAVAAAAAPQANMPGVPEPTEDQLLVEAQLGSKAGAVADVTAVAAAAAAASGHQQSVDTSVETPRSVAPVSEAVPAATEPAKLEHDIQDAQAAVLAAVSGTTAGTAAAEVEIAPPVYVLDVTAPPAAETKAPAGEPTLPGVHDG